MILQNKNVRQLVHRYRSELYCYNTEGDRNSVVSQGSCRMLELQTERDIEKRIIYEILREDLHLRKTASK